MAKFKVGDIVKRTSGSWGGMNVGDIGTVESVTTKSNGLILLKIQCFGDKHGADFFELVFEGWEQIVPSRTFSDIMKESRTAGGCTCEKRIVVNFGCNCEAGKAELAMERAR